MKDATLHKPDPIRAQGRCRVDCSCGWRGPLVSMFGQGHGPWAEHYKEAAMSEIDVHDFPMVSSEDRMHEGDRSCWCHPDVVEPRFGGGLTHVIHHDESTVDG